MNRDEGLDIWIVTFLRFWKNKFINSVDAIYSKANSFKNLDWVTFFYIFTAHEKHVSIMKIQVFVAARNGYIPSKSDKSQTLNTKSVILS